MTKTHIFVGVFDRLLQDAKQPLHYTENVASRWQMLVATSVEQVLAKPFLYLGRLDEVSRRVWHFERIDHLHILSSEQFKMEPSLDGK